MECRDASRESAPDDAPVTEHDAEITPPIERAAQNEEESQLMRYLDHLPERERQVWERRYRGETLDDIARRLNCSASDATGLLRRARVKLKRLAAKQ